MKINSTTYLNFTKTLYAKCNVQKGDEYYPCNIFKLEENKDEDYISNLKNPEDWRNNHFLENVRRDMALMSKIPLTHFFTIEDEGKNCLGYCEISNNKQSFYLDLLEVAPKYSNENKNSKYKYIGETFLSFLATLAKKENKAPIYVCPRQNAVGFYIKNCFFTTEMINYSNVTVAALESKNYENLINKNRKHTNSKIEIIA